MSKQKCIHCNHIWDYKGLYTIKTTCPNCQMKTPIIRTEEELDLIKQLREAEQE
jgi:Zn finger protein HypA/HybF involved in hydrogenase expression